jgi:hypothetical protein
MPVPSSTTGNGIAAGDRISAGFVESTINQVIAKRFVKKQQMRWTPRGEIVRERSTKFDRVIKKGIVVDGTLQA